MFMGQDGFIWWIGVVEDNNDPLLIGRAKVRIFGYHPKTTANDASPSSTNNQLGVAYLPWAIPIMPLNMGNAYGKIAVGEWVFGFFLDGENAQEPAMIGYLPAAYKQKSMSFGKNETQRNFKDLGGPIPDGVYYGADFSSKSNRFEWHTPSNHHIRMTDDGTQRDMTFAHSHPNMYFIMRHDTQNGVKQISINHPNSNALDLYNDTVELKLGSSTSILLNGTDIIVKSPRGTYELIEQLNWISLQTHTTSSGSEYGSRTFNIGRRPPPPPPPPPPGRGRRGCFIASSLISMSDGTKKRINEIQIGDFVFSKDKTKLNKVRFVEIVNAKKYKQLYSPSNAVEPFATLDHPIYINDELTSVDPKLTYKMYPWLDKTKKMETYVIDDNTENFVYNLWVDGDGTYVVNDYGTTSIIFDGGMLCDQIESNQFTVDEVQKLYSEYTSRGNFLLHGAYVLNYLIGNLKCKSLNYIISRIGKKPYYHPMRWPVTISMYATSLICHATSFLHKWRFRK